MIQRGDVWWYTPENEKARPYIVLSRDDSIPHLNKLIAVPTTRRGRGIPSEILLDQSNGMPAECVANTDNTDSIYKAYCTTRITQLSAPMMNAICIALSRSTGCSL